MNQKKKTQTTSANRLKHIKSAENLPLAPLMQEIGQLKAELTQIKQSKRRESTNPNLTNYVIPQNHKKSRNLITTQLPSLKKEYRYKLQLQLQSIRKELQLLEPAISQNFADIVNKLIQYFCEQINEVVAEKDSLQAELHKLVSQKQTQDKQSQQKFAVLARNNKRLEREVEELRNKITMRLRDTSQKQQELLMQCERQSQVIEELKLQLKQMTKTNLQLESLVQEWELQCRQLQEARINNEATINAKEDEIRSFQEDIQYLRIEAEKFKAQKRQFEKLWQKANLDLRELKRTYEQDLAKAQRERNRWMNECAFRRHQSQQIQAIEAEKELLFKQIQQTRSNYTLKCRELAQKSTLLHQLQRKMISLESQNFKLSNQSERLRRQTGYWSNEMGELREQVNKLNNLKVQMKGASQGNEKRSRQKKFKALNDIFSLIQLQREDNVGESTV